MGKKAIIIGAGLAGLSAAYYLEQSGYSCDILEKSDRIGGRLKTDIVDGFRLDHGFQVLLDAYPECQRLLNYDKLDLQKFDSGAVLLHDDGSRSLVADPRRHFGRILSSLQAKLGGLGDKMNVLSLAKRLSNTYIDELFEDDESTTKAFLSEHFGEEINSNFFYPFFRGILLDRDLTTSSRMFEFVFKMFAKGHATLPAGGMQAIPDMISAQLQRSTILINTEVSQIAGHDVHTVDDQHFKGDVIVIATEANAFLSKYRPDTSTKCVSNTTVYFKSKEALTKDKFLILNTKSDALVNHLVQLDQMAPSYAPAGAHLIACSLLGGHGHDHQLIHRIKAELAPLLGPGGAQWEHLKTYDIPYALPDQETVTNTLSLASAKINDTTYCCGDHLLNGSINAAMKSGRQVAEWIAG